MFGIKKYPDADLVADIRAGGRPETAAISYLIRQNRQKIIQLIVQRNGSRADAEDVLQEGLTALVLNIRKGVFKGESSVHTYLYAICKGIWFKRFKKYVREQEHQRTMVVAEEDLQTPDISLMDEQQRQVLTALFDHLREKCKELLFLWAAAYSMSEIAEELAYSNAQVAMNKKNKCLKQLHELMQNNANVQQLIKEL